ncbi:MAG: hypothetical protein HY084_02000 [Gemmatimonadetes bacterium]|nr:hypothetical protein [Gemmatimonadota bacterium]
MTARLAALFDAIERRSERASSRRFASAALIIVFLGMVALVEAARGGLLPEPWAARVPRSQFAAVWVVFTALLALEVAGLVFALARSVAASVGKQLELIALILMREAFIALLPTGGDAGAWDAVRGGVPHALSQMAGSLLVFALLVPFHRMQRHRAITTDAAEQESFVRAKKVVALLLLGVFVTLAGVWGVRTLQGGEAGDFYAVFFTVLVLSDVLLILLSLRHSATFHVVYRNAGFAAATLMMRLALGAPPYVSAALAVAAAVFSLGMVYAYNAWSDLDPAERA